ncbi:MAG: tannase/feruloyl esterase family alpha/beta hydrolase, partial [Acidobacteriota bacterium]|nr:tannase/feruloyl esterase family alpha/beta hydrolase [Acidobacteriota bacterium]
GGGRTIYGSSWHGESAENCHGMNQISDIIFIDAFENQVKVRTTVFLLLCSVGSLQMVAQNSATGTITRSDPTISCRSLRGMTVPASAIGLTTSSAYVSSAKLVRDRRGEYCKVLGGIRPVDPAAQDIRFEVNLPTQWNHKAVQFGGGSFDGYLGASDGLDRTVASVASQPGPLARGFATFGGDSGHHKHYLFLPDVVNVVNASFARNPEQRRNFAQDGLKKTHDAAMAIIERRYGTPPARMFFLGGSTGGREAYFVVQRWPDDYDGVLGAYAGWNQTELDLQFIRVSQAMYANGGFLPKTKTKLLAKSVMDACDSLDGIRDGIIANVAACHFDPATLLCPTGNDKKSCLTPQQLKTVRTFATEQRTDKPLWNGIQAIPGFNVLAGTDLTGSMGLLHHAEHPPKVLLNSFYYVIGDQVLRYFLTGDVHFNALTFDTNSGGKYARELLPQSEASDASNADLTRFASHGGKFIMLHGTTDATIPTNSSVMYYEMVQSKMSQQQMDNFLRFYLIPGFGHGRGVFNAGFDALGILDRWLDTGVGPTNLIVVDNNKSSQGRTRPLCGYPGWPKYKGSGDVNAASSFECVAE